MNERESYLQSLLLTNPLREPTIRMAIDALGLPHGSRGLDAGCGIGLQALLLAEAVGPSGNITGVDVSPEFIAYARGVAEKSGLAARISFREADVNRLDFEDDSFDWAWSVDCIGYAPFDPALALKELMRVVKPGGNVITLFWSSQRLLPGYPLLEAHLDATTPGIAPFVTGSRPELHGLRALGQFQEVGLEEPSAQTFVSTVQAPLDDDTRRALVSLLQMRWPDVRSELSPKDWVEFQRLCQPESPDFILDLPDYYAFFTYSMFRGTVPK